MTTKEFEQLANQAQIYQQQMQNVVTQKAALTMERNELKKATEEIENSKEESVYKIAGPILVKADAAKVKKDLEERLEFIDLKVKSIEKQEGMIRERLEDLRTKLMASEKGKGR
ncbi:MAG: prefoldin subunit beta [Candidatus Aenigmarchaeota archaeon]|nr:prefoldin subunit beta [Candidatus Aenigmarchaeota archaeon]